MRKGDLLGFLDFRRAMTAQFSSQVADVITPLTIAQVPLFVVAGPLAGYIADSKSRRATLVVGHLLRALVTFAAAAPRYVSWH